ncbi:MAG: FmdE family protein [Syntrophales bacterium]|nr:FmdE family protein [Syntrophales bacterium]
MYPEDYQKSIEFHGHSCPGLAIGYRAVKAAIEKLDLKRAGDEELVAIVENDSCSVDAVQCLLGCTFGKGNLVFKNYGKQVFTFGERTTGKAVRVSLLPGALEPPKKLIEEEVQRMREKKVEKILHSHEKDLFQVEEVKIPLPAKAQIRSSVLCDLCGEPAMETQTVQKEGKTYCLPCANDLSK